MYLCEKIIFYCKIFRVINNPPYDAIHQNRFSKQCPESKECLQMYLIWWSSTGLTASVMLIELDRFLAIRYPLKYPLERHNLANLTFG